MHAELTSKTISFALKDQHPIPANYKGTFAKSTHPIFKGLGRFVFHLSLGDSAPAPTSFIRLCPGWRNITLKISPKHLYSGGWGRYPQKTVAGGKIQPWLGSRWLYPSLRRQPFSDQVCKIFMVKVVLLFNFKMNPKDDIVQYVGTIPLLAKRYKIQGRLLSEA